MSDLSYIVRVAVTTVAAASLAIILTLLIGLYNPLVDNKMIFDVLGPMAHEITGAMLLLVGGITTHYLTKPSEPKGPTE